MRTVKCRSHATSSSGKYPNSPEFYKHLPIFTTFSFSLHPRDCPGDSPQQCLRAGPRLPGPRATELQFSSSSRNPWPHGRLRSCPGTGDVPSGRRVGAAVLTVCRSSQPAQAPAKLSAVSHQISRGCESARPHQMLEARAGIPSQGLSFPGRSSLLTSPPSRPGSGSAVLRSMLVSSTGP
uniref:Uncharacterized protein n=1 Tax=Mustela putorius furo TaxID=9669 RepID=M3YTQ8_MUSPF